MALAVMFFHLGAILTQPSIAAIGTHIRAVSTHRALTRPPLSVSFPRAPILRVGQAIRASIPARLAHGKNT
eukprot:9496890-Pyramimonas_sp.AAC.1